MVYYRKYRSQTIDELDSEQLRNSLTSVFLREKKSPKGSYELAHDIPHAFLFTGPKGLGKTSTARIVAKVLNCTQLQIDGKSLVLCREKCEQCKSIGNGTNLDVLEIDGASNRGIDEIRDLREKVRLAPLSAHKKVYIIDEVHMLTTEAFNALLKTIEEPPEHVVFIFCTTESHKVPATIVSRCFHIPFHVATPDELARSFTRVLTGEKLQADQDTLLAIAGMADGSFRDGIKMLEELAMHAANGKITPELLEQTFRNNSVSDASWQLLTYLAEKDTKQAIVLIEKVNSQGINVLYFVSSVITLIHQQVLQQAGVIEKSGKEITLSLSDLRFLALLFAKVYKEVKIAAIPALPLELAVIEWTARQNQESTVAWGPASVFPPANLRSKPFSPKRNSDERQIIESPSNRVTPRVDTKDSTLQDTKAIFETLVAKTKSQNQSIAGVLRGCKIRSYDGKSLIIETKYKFHKERLDETKAMHILKQVTEEISGNPVAVSILLSE